MGMSECVECWETPCSCGYGYRNYSIERTVDFLNAILKYRSDLDKSIILGMVNRGSESSSNKLEDKIEKL